MLRTIPIEKLLSCRHGGPDAFRLPLRPHCVPSSLLHLRPRDNAAALFPRVPLCLLPEVSGWWEENYMIGKGGKKRRES
jgi:hypothetical protein